EDETSRKTPSIAPAGGAGNGHAGQAADTGWRLKMNRDVRMTQVMTVRSRPVRRVVRLSAVGDAGFGGADAGAGGALDDGLDVGQRADHRDLAGVAGELDGGLHLGPHGAGGEAEALQFVRMALGDGLLA